MTMQFKPDTLCEDLAGQWPATGEVIAAVLADWPQHARYIAKSLNARDQPQMATTETLAQAALVLAGDKRATIAAHYRWTCDRLREEELYFHREGRYRLSTFEDADREVYSNPDYMEKYMDGLLFSQVVWFNHAASCHFFLTETPRLLQRGGRLLEIGPGHGLMMALALRDFGLTEAVAWDLSQVSLDQTRHALELLGYRDCRFAVQNVMHVAPDAEPYDLVVLSEVLEHLEDPKSVMTPLRDLVHPETGLIFINVPINSPSPDHLYLMQTQDDARALLTETGFELVNEGFYATQGTALDRALRNRVSISACMLARPV